MYTHPYSALPGGEAEAEKKTNALYEHDACFEPFDIFAQTPFDEKKRAAPMVHFFLVQNTGAFSYNP